MKKSCNFRLDEKVIKKIEDAVIQLNQYVGYEQYNKTDIVEKLTMKYIDYLVQAEKTNYDQTFPGALKKMMEAKE